MQSMSDPEHQNSQDSCPLKPCALWSVDLRLTHLDWNPEATLIHFQGQYLTVCELDYNILQGEIQNVPKTKAAVEIGEFCLVEDLTSARWFRGRVQNRKDDLFDVFLVDHGNMLTVDVAHISSCSNDLFNLPPKIVCGFLANVLLLQNCSHSVVEGYFSSLIGRSVTGFIQALLPHKVILLEAPDINSDLVRHGFGRHMDTDTFLLLVGMLTEVPLKQNIESVPDLLIEKPGVQGFSFKSSILQGFKDILSFCGSRLSCGTRVEVRVTAAVHLGLFYCQMTNAEEKLRHISGKLASVYEYRTNKSNQKTPENLGLLCAVKGKDDSWYRGFVQFLPINSQVRVFFIDYGFFEFVKVENVHRLPSEFYSTPVMALPCSLLSQNHQDMEFKAQQLSFLKAGLLGDILDVEMGGFNEEQHLYTITVLGTKNTYVKEPEPVQNLPSKSVLDDEMSSPFGYMDYETILVKALDKTLEAEGLQAGAVFEGLVEVAQNPNNFWIRTEKRNEEFEEMMSEISKHFSQVKLNEEVLPDPDFGVMCCAMYEEDMHFYRGVVMDILEHGAEILFIDFGNIEKVPHMLIKNLPDTFANKSAFAFCCTLVNIFPLDDIWTSATCDLFRTAVSNKTFQVRIIQVQKHKCVVDLLEMGSEKSVIDLLVSSKLAEYIPIEPAALNSKDVTEKTRRPQCAGTGGVTGLSQLWVDCEEKKNMCKSETEKVEGSFKALSIKPGSEFPVRCSYIRSPSEFWCQPLVKCLTLEKLMFDIQQYYSVHTVALQPTESCCVVKSPQDRKWHRGFVVKRQRCHATVMLVDYGTTVQVRMNYLQAIMPQFSQLERQAFRCSFNKLIEPEDPSSEDWSPQACHLLKDFVLKSTNSLKCQIVSQLNVKNKGLCNVVELYNIQTQQSVTNTLIEMGLARRATASMKQELDVIPESFIFSSFDLNPGTEEQVYVTYISSQCEIYCHLEKNTGIIEELDKKISEEREKIMQTNMNTDVKKLCLAKYLDNNWYRGLLLPLHFPLHVSVFFVDYGNTSILEKNKVLLIPRNCEDLLYTPMQAVKCNLHSVPKEELCVDVKKWLTDAVLNKMVRAVIRAKREDGSFDIELFDGEINVNEKVKKLIAQKPKPDDKLSGRKIQNKNQHPRNTKMHFKGKRQSSDSTSNVLKITNWKNTKVKQKQENKKKSSVSVKPQTTSDKKQTKKPKQTQMREETKVSQLPRFPERNISPGFRARCFVSHIDSVSSFFLQLSEDEPDILKLGEDLNSSIFRDSLKTASSSRVNDVVLAEFEGDGGLYRSVIKNLEGSSGFRVEFLDYGNSAVVTREKIYPLPEEFQSQPRFSIACTLLDTSTYENDAAFTDALMEKPLMVDFICWNRIQWQVRVEVLTGDAGHDESPESTILTQTNDSLPSSHKTSETVSSETVAAVEGENVTPEPHKVTRSAKRKAKTARYHKKMNFRKLICWKTKTCVKKDCAEVFLPLPEVKPGDTETGTILWVQTDGSFYVRLAKNNDLLTVLEMQIADSMKTCKTVAQADVKQGLKCLVQIQDKWRRAVVQDVSEGTFKVFLMDYGTTKDIPSGSVPQQCTELTKFHSLAVLCKMTSSGFSEEEEAHQHWYETLEPMKGSEVKLLFKSYSKTRDLWVVEIMINELLFIHQIKASFQKGTKNSSSAGPQAEQARPTSDPGAPQKLVLAPFDIDKAYSGFAAAVTTPSQFYVVLEDLLPVMNKVSIMLDNLPLEMPPLPQPHLIPGTCCLLESESRNKCRAEVVHVDKTVVLNLVDYGHNENIPYGDISKLKMLPVELTKLPKVTYPCVLRGVEPAAGDGQWTDEAADFFQKCLYHKNLQIFFREFVSSSDCRVDILTDGFHVAKKLVDAGHANYMLKPRFQSTSSCQTSGVEDEEGSYEVWETDGNKSVNMKPKSNQCFLM